MSSGDALQVRWMFNRQFAKKITKLADKTIFKSDEHLEYAQNLRLDKNTVSPFAYTVYTAPVS